MRPSRMTPENWSLLELYASTVLMGGAPLFAKLVPVSADVLTLLRSLIGAIALGGFIRILGTGLALRRRKDYLIIALIGVVMALHWITYIHAIRVSTVAAALIGFFTFPILTALLEPLFFYGNGFTYKDILSGLGIFAGALILSLGADTGSNVGLGLMWGMVSAILFVLRSLLLKKYMAGTNGAVAMFHQMIAIALILAPFSAWTQITASLSFIPLILVFAIVFTAIAHTLYARSLAHLRPTTVSFVFSLHPLFGILFAALFLEEIPSLSTAIGGSVIVAVALLESVRTARAAQLARGRATQDLKAQDLKAQDLKAAGPPAAEPLSAAR